MTITDYIILSVILLIVGGAVAYIISAKKRGVKCIGCADAKKCSGNCSSCHDCQCKNDNKQ